MTQHFVVTLRFPDSRFHGRAQGEAREWPPSPLRVFQALVASAARLNPKLDGAEHYALQFLERLPAPIVIAPKPEYLDGYRLSVPNNEMDLVAKAWAAGKYFEHGGDNDPATHRTMKRVTPILIPEDSCIQYLWQVDQGSDLSPLFQVARAMSACGWGLDMVVGDARILPSEDTGESNTQKWLPVSMGATVRLRTPADGTLLALKKRHTEFLGRLGPDGMTLTPPAPLSAFRLVGYRRADEPAPKAVAAFKFMLPDASRYRSFDTARRGLTVAGMMRHVLSRCARKAGWEEQRINSQVLGHQKETQATGSVDTSLGRLAILPLPSIEFRGDARGEVAGAIRRVLVTSFSAGMGEVIQWAGKALSGDDLIDEGTGEVVASLSQIPKDDQVLGRYLGYSSSWTTVTPVVLPGFDDPGHLRRKMDRGVTAEEQKRMLLQLDNRVDGLLRKAIVQAGFPEAWARNAKLDWNRTGFFPGVQPVSSYGIPDHLKKYPRFHVRIDWTDGQGNSMQVEGPVCLGGGRYLGVGLLVGVNWEFN